MFLLLFVAFVPGLIHMISMAALASMLVVTGVRLASPSEFRRTFEIGREQLVIFLVTLVTTLATDLLVGVGVGIFTKVGLLAHGASFRGIFRPRYDLQPGPEGLVVEARRAGFVTGLVSFAAALEQHPETKTVIVDLTAARFVDHTFLDKLETLRAELENQHGSLRVVGLEHLEAFSTHPLAARRSPKIATAS